MSEDTGISLGFYHAVLTEDLGMRDVSDKLRQA
jgi:hypothetical protein